MATPLRMLLRPVEERDLELMLAWRNSERIRANMYTGHLITPAEHRAWFDRLSLDRETFAFLFEYEGRPLGIVNLNHLDWRNLRCHWGFYLGETDAPPGSGTRMAYLALIHIFEELKLHKVIGEAFAFNAASIAYHKKLGFSQEAHFVEHVLKDGSYLDILSFALLSRDWPRIKAELEKKCL
jgi:UDP-4-amino-4,6-dideoxy-N-acetyl-beta-L-altrosamine N-acetyltransferase